VSAKAKCAWCGKAAAVLCEWEIRYRTHTMMARRFIYITRQKVAGQKQAFIMQTPLWCAGNACPIRTHAAFCKHKTAGHSFKIFPEPGGKQECESRGNAKYREKKAALNFKNSSLIFAACGGLAARRDTGGARQTFPSQKKS
jgi:hypothetical protein